MTKREETLLSEIERLDKKAGEVGLTTKEDEFFDYLCSTYNEEYN